MSPPKEDPEVTAMREREATIAKRERARAAQKTSQGLTLDYASVYGMPSLLK